MSADAELSPVEQLLAEAACRRLVLEAAQAVDHGQPADFAALFAEDGVLMRPNGQALEGRAAIEAAYAARPAGRITRHLVTATLVSFVSATQAHGLSPVVLWSGSGDDPAGPQGRPARGPQVLGEFDDLFVLTQSEGWRIARREARFTLHTTA